MEEKELSFFNFAPQIENMAENKFLKKMQLKWGLKNIFQTVMVLIVFAFTGSTVLLIKPLIFDLVGFEHIKGVWGILLYIILIFPLYQILILIYGFLFGQFAFFWKWEKQMVDRIGRLFRKKSNS